MSENITIDFSRPAALQAGAFSFGPPHNMTDKAAAALIEIARRLHREDRHEIAAEVETVARTLQGRIDPPRIRRRPTEAAREVIGKRVVIVQVRRRAGFGL
jgi:hypothetical protein